MTKPMMVYRLAAHPKLRGPRLFRPFEIMFITGSRDRSPWREKSRQQLLMRQQQEMLCRGWRKVKQVSNIEISQKMNDVHQEENE